MCRENSLRTVHAHVHRGALREIWGCAGVSKCIVPALASPSHSWRSPAFPGWVPGSQPASPFHTQDPTAEEGGGIRVAVRMQKTACITSWGRGQGSVDQGIQAESFVLNNVRWHCSDNQYPDPQSHTPRWSCSCLSSSGPKRLLNNVSLEAHCWPNNPCENKV